MSESRVPPNILLNQPSAEEDPEAVPPGFASKANIARSHSAPQAENQFTALRMGVKNKGSPSSPKKFPQGNGTQTIPTLSDGVVLVNQEQAALVAADVLSSHNHHQGASGPEGDGSVSPMSPTPLCDANHSPSSTKRYYEASPMYSEESRPDDVWQRREQFVASGRSQEVNSEELVEYDATTTGNTMLRSELRERRAKKLSQSSSQQDGELVNGAQRSDAQNSVDSKAVTNGSSDSVNGTSSAAGSQSSNSSIAELRDGIEGDTRRYRNPLRQAQSEVLLPSEMQRKMSLADVKEKGYAWLEEELTKAQRALELKDEEVDELRGIRERLMKEVSDFTASLFEEVNAQLNEAALNEQHAKKQLQEANTKIEMLSAEVTALKDLVLTSTPASPNKHLHPQIDTQKKEKGSKPFWKTHRRSTSHHQFTKDSREKAEANQHHSHLKEMDNNAFDEFARWRLQPNMDFSCQFLNRVHEEDITPCLNFKNTRLAERLLESVRNNSLSIEPIPGDHSFPRKCSLSETHKLCNFKIRFEGDDEWHSISQMSRNRIAAVCDFYAYTRYIVQGLVKSSDKDMFVEVVRLRNQMAQARLGVI
ncbi:guanine nucleotide exchange factor for Rab-3A [Aplysia californica]|uniref:Guanine nucleotide exchange factor for Rab-3A n=1 Tax=Aplysia californica TaxID=6500 RepID=A0ABM0JAP7_APLCA|nr:guanine nucleotide exchange factor for Rab-3A [Aplysia californica]XP_035824557.1 guanine nucleotide exchange factor for Rab-3A [Aplysia californica]